MPWCAPPSSSRAARRSPSTTRRRSPTSAGAYLAYLANDALNVYDTVTGDTFVLTVLPLKEIDRLADVLAEREGRILNLSGQEGARVAKGEMLSYGDVVDLLRVVLARDGELVTGSGERLYAGPQVPVRTSRVGLVVWLVMGVAATVFFATIVVRIVRRVRRRRRTHGPVLRRDA